MAINLSGINTGIICHNDKFAALALKIKDSKKKEHLFFFPLVVLKDFMLALEYRLAMQSLSAGSAQEEQRKAIVSASKKMQKQIPELVKSELQEADINQRVNQISLCESANGQLTFSLLLHSGNSHELTITDGQIELLVTAIIHAINNAGMKEIAISLSSLLDFLPLYDADFLADGNVEYDTYHQDEWKKSLFPHTMAVIYYRTDDMGQRQFSGTVIKTRCTSDSDDMASISRRLLEFSQRLNKLKGQPCQVCVRTLTHEKQQPLSLEQCMHGLQALQQQIKQEEHSGK